ncbi:ATP-grasp domain-containing protein [Sphingomonas sp. 3-13AW]|uniref:ATP-grasp domain-containing protein n=1 Tax=Sphingomonas sp. 3-13AW TaxID=3050450 RepID=UPI003BB489D8
MRIWFNQGHTLYQTLRGMEERVPGVTMLVSAKAAMSPAAMAGSETWSEPTGLAGADYADWALEKALEKRVDIFFPQKEVVAIAEAAERFAAAGIRLELPGDPATIRLLDDKAAMAEDLQGDPVLAPTIRASGAEAVAKAVDTIRALGVDACVKPAHGIFARGYWHLVEDDLLDCLDNIGSRRMPLATYLSAISQAERKGSPVDLIVMQHLPGPEASVDAHVRDGRLLRAVTRVKIKGGTQKVVGGHELVRVAARLASRYRLNGVVNVQFKPTSNGEWKILEINPRMAGGLSYGIPVGVDLAADWVRCAMGQSIDPVEDAFDHVVNFYTEAIIRGHTASKQ